MKRDIQSKNDIEILVKEFYNSLLQTPEIQPFFSTLDLTSHLPKMISFWCFILLDEPGYKTNVTQLHENIPFQKQHMSIWLDLFIRTIDSNFTGIKASMAKERATLLGHTMLYQKNRKI